MIVFRLALALLLCAPAAAQITIYTGDDAEARLRLSGQFRFSALNDDATDAERIGFGVRRARLQLFADVGDRLGSFVQLEGAGGGLSLVDALVSYEIADDVRLRGGRFIGAQPVAYALTPFFRLDAVDRPVIVRQWAARTIGPAGRDFGVEAVATPGDVEARLWLHNGDGSWDRLRGNVRDDVGLGDPTRGVETSGLAVSGAVAWRPSAVPGLDVGGYAGANSSENPNTAAVAGGPGRSYRSASAHLYWGRFPGSQPVRLKADAVVVDYAENGLDAPSETFGGVALFGAVQPARGVEVFAQGERYSPDIGGDRDVTLATLGASLSLSALRGGRFETARLTGGYTVRFGDDDRVGPGADGFVVQLQLIN